MRVFFLFLLLAMLLATSVSADQQVYILKKPKKVEDEVRSEYVNEDLGFGFDLAEGFKFTEWDLEDEGFTLDVILDGYPIQAALVIEEFDEDVSASGYWEKMLDDNPNLETVVVYERKTDIAGHPAIQVRLEEMISGNYLLYVSILFTSGNHGYFISVFCDSLLYEEVPDFFEEIIDGFYFLEDDDEIDEEGPGEVEDVPEESGDE